MASPRPPQPYSPRKKISKGGGVTDKNAQYIPLHPGEKLTGVKLDTGKPGSHVRGLDRLDLNGGKGNGKAYQKVIILLI